MTTQQQRLAAQRAAAASQPATNPYTAAAHDNSIGPWDWAGQSQRANALTQESVWNSNQANQRAAQSAADNANSWQNAQRQRITDLTEGRASDLANDPRMNQAMDFFGQVLGGSKLPFSEETQRAQLNQQANGTAAANASQLRALEEAITARGGSLNDPSFQAQKQELMANRQGQNLDALGRMLAQAGTANFNAQAQGANSLAGIRSGQNNQINQMNLAGAGYRAQDFRDTPTGGSTTTTTYGPPLGQPATQAPQFNPTGAYSPQAANNPAVRPGLAGSPPGGVTGASGYTTSTPLGPSGGHTLATGNTWGGQPYGGAPAASRPTQLPPLYNQMGSPFYRPVGPNF